MSGVIFAESGGGEIVQSRRWGLSASFSISYDAQGMPVLDVSTSPGSDHDIEDHNDTVMSGLAEGQAMMRNGSSQWVNRDLTAADIQSGTLATARGGTNLGTYVQGDLLYASAANVLSALAVPVLDGWVLTYDSGTDLPEWRAPDVGTVYAEDVGGTNDSERTFEVDGKYTFQNALDIGGHLQLNGLTSSLQVEPSVGAAGITATRPTTSVGSQVMMQTTGGSDRFWLAIVGSDTTNGYIGTGATASAAAASMGFVIASQDVEFYGTTITMADAAAIVTTADGDFTVSGGSSAVLGANVIFHGESRSADPSDIIFSASATEVLIWDHSSSRWETGFPIHPYQVWVGPGILLVNSTSGNQLTVRYDSSNYMDVDVTSTGVTTFNAVGSGASFEFSDIINNFTSQSITDNGTILALAPSSYTSVNLAIGSGTGVLQVGVSVSGASNITSLGITGQSNNPYVTFQADEANDWVKWRVYADRLIWQVVDNDKLELTAAALHPDASGELTLGTATEPWGATYIGALTATTGVFSGDVHIQTSVTQYELDVGNGAGTGSGAIGFYSDGTHYAYMRPYNSATADFEFVTENAAAGEFVFTGGAMVVNAGITATTGTFTGHVDISVNQRIRTSTYPDYSYLGLEEDAAWGANEVALSAVGGLNFIIDANDNETIQQFRFYHNGTTVGTSDLIATLSESGALVITGALTATTGTFAGDVTMTGGTTRVLAASTASGSLVLRAQTGVASAQLRLLGPSHGTQADDIELSNSNGVVALYDDSVNNWQFGIAGTPELVLSTTALYPYADLGLNLGAASNAFASGYINSLYMENGVIRSTTTSMQLTVAGGTGAASGSNIALFGPAHASASDILFRAGATTVAAWDNSDDRWEFTKAVTFGDGGATDYAQFSTTGVLSFVGTAGLSCGNMWIHEDAVTITISANDTYYQITGFTAGNLNGCTVVSDSLRVPIIGLYFITWNVSGDSAGVNEEYEFDTFVNDVGQDTASGTNEFAAIAAKSNTGASGIIDVTNTSHDIDLRIKQTSAGTDDFVVNSANVTVFHLSGT